ncbi:hypothetical protein [Actinacidiphila acididurans]|uniref:Integral membrane protein n=1 Tax=Actinacidiphila acididurans TaxID=2784346 RepID=A0ABS2TWS8_9ACTN|nr:hypothetical protein [Actinacidiphila acididurans]MBM9507537.1 hypothetical protein [Actinacidiphila acididurans]
MAEQAQSEDDDALFVLTAAMLTPGRFPGVLGDDYPAACARLGLEPLGSGYGLMFGQDGTGARWTVATTDAVMVACALAAWDCGLEYDLAPGEETTAASLPGWPLPVAVAVPGIPEPHDPDEESAGRPPLAPPDTTVWGPPQRRLGADEIAVNWWAWRDQFTAPEEAAPPAEAVPQGAQENDGPTAEAAGNGDHQDSAEEAAGNDDHAARQAADEKAPAISHPGVRQVLAAAEEYVRNPPPPGRVRTAYGAVRADGPGWSLVGRTDDMAFVLMDDAPGEVLPVGRGPALPPLLGALEELAARWEQAAVSPV